MNRIVSMVLLVIGGVLLVFAYRSSNAPVDQITNALTGRFTDTTVEYLVLGLICVVVGALLSWRRSGTA
ncbi:MAG: DUF3185 family protein [Rhodospirillaceae bacterium]